MVHCYADSRKDRLYLIGRLEDGFSFAAVESSWRPSFHIRTGDRERAERVLSSLKFEIRAPLLEAFDGREKLLLLKFTHYRDYTAAGKSLEQAGILSPDADLKVPDAFCIQRHIRGPVELEGEARPGRLSPGALSHNNLTPGKRLVDLVFPNPVIRSADETSAVLKIASVDIETDVEDGTILAIAMSVNPGGASLVRVLCGIQDTVKTEQPAAPGRLSGAMNGSPCGREKILFHQDEASLLASFIDDIQKADPDVITGWNFLDFDFPRLAERCACNGIPFKLGRSMEESKFFPSSSNEPGSPDNDQRSRRRSAAAIVQGRQVLDALRIYRSSPRAGGGGRWDSSSYSLEAVANSVLGEGKLVSSAGNSKIEELKELYQKDPVRFGEYCLRDAELVLRILEKTGLFRLTAERASLTGVSLDKAWTSVVSFERIYGMELYRKGIAPVPNDPRRFVSGASGGTVLDPMPGLFNNVAVFDFRSLYPTIMLTFNIDPWAFALAQAGAHAKSDARAHPKPEAGTSAGAEKDSGKRTIVAPNGAAFSPDGGILPELISGYFASRRRALEAGDEEASYVYKILMNSFYGVLGTASCRYGRTELAGAITSFAKKWLHFSRDRFTQAGYRVLYGDTDSLFVETGLTDDSSYSDFLEWGKSSAAEINAALTRQVKEEYGLGSFMELRFEKPYRRFMIPHLRNTAGESRGRAKGYGGYLLDPRGGASIEVKGMEAVRSDYTQLARRIQIELLGLVFTGSTEADFKNHVEGIIRDLRLGKLDGELIYRKRLSRSPETYTSSTPPQVKAARALGWKNRRGTVEFVWTINGPEPSFDGNGYSLPHSPLDYEHYADSQVLPAARSIAAAAGWGGELFPSPGRDYFRDGQLQLGL